MSGMIGDIFTFSLYFLMVKTYFAGNQVSTNAIFPKHYIGIMQRRSISFLPTSHFFSFATPKQYQDVDGKFTAVCWMIAYTMSIALRHTTHKILVFGEYDGTYCGSLFRMYGAYAAGISVTTVSNALLTDALHDSSIAAGINILWSGVFNYFVIKTCWGSKKVEDAPEDAQSHVEYRSVSQRDGDLSSVDV